MEAPPPIFVSAGAASLLRSEAVVVEGGACITTSPAATDSPELPRFLYKKGITPDNERAAHAASRMERCLETRQLIQLSSGPNIREYSMAAWSTRKILPALETIVPSSRTNAPAPQSWTSTDEHRRR